MFDSLESFINAQTVVSGASIKWDTERLKRKFDKLAVIGEMPVLLTNDQGDRLCASHCAHDAFVTSIREHGGEIGTSTSRMNHPLFQAAHPIKLLEQGDDPEKIPEISGALISYNAALEPFFYRPAAFINALDRAH